jgi:hypothetical protein
MGQLKFRHVVAIQPVENLHVASNGRSFKYEFFKLPLRGYLKVFGICNFSLILTLLYIYNIF